MVSDWIGYILLGIVGGFSEILPVSATANDRILRMFFGLPEDGGLLRLAIRTGCLVTLFVRCGGRLVHIYRQLKMTRLPARRRRFVDANAIRNGRLLAGAVIPTVAAAILGSVYYSHFQSLPAMTGLLVLTGICVYIPQHFPSGNRDSRGMSRMDGLLLGLVGGLSVLPGMSGMGMMLCVGLLRGCDREYILELSFMLSVTVLGVMAILDVIGLAVGGFAAVGFTLLIAALIVGLLAFATSYTAISILRYLAVRVGFSGFAYYSWGLAMLTVILYLMT